MYNSNYKFVFWVVVLEYLQILHFKIKNENFKLKIKIGIRIFEYMEIQDEIMEVQEEGVPFLSSLFHL